MPPTGIVIKMEQAGTVTGALEMVEKARRAGREVILSNGFRETEEAFLGDMAVAVRADYVKSGAPCREDVRRSTMSFCVLRNFTVKGKYN